MLSPESDLFAEYSPEGTLLGSMNNFVAMASINAEQRMDTSGTIQIHSSRPDVSAAAAAVNEAGPSHRNTPIPDPRSSADLIVLGSTNPSPPPAPTPSSTTATPPSSSHTGEGYQQSASIADLSSPFLSFSPSLNDNYNDEDSFSSSSYLENMRTPMSANRNRPIRLFHLAKPILEKFVQTSRTSIPFNFSSRAELEGVYCSFIQYVQAHPSSDPSLFFGEEKKAIKEWNLVVKESKDPFFKNLSARITYDCAKRYQNYSSLSITNKMLVFRQSFCHLTVMLHDLRGKNNFGPSIKKGAEEFQTHIGGKLRDVHLMFTTSRTGLSKPNCFQNLKPPLLADFAPDSVQLDPPAEHLLPPIQNVKELDRVQTVRKSVADAKVSGITATEKIKELTDQLAMWEKLKADAAGIEAAGTEEIRSSTAVLEAARHIKDDELIVALGKLARSNKPALKEVWDVILANLPDGVDDMEEKGEQHVRKKRKRPSTSSQASTE